MLPTSKMKDINGNIKVKVQRSKSMNTATGCFLDLHIGCISSATSNSTMSLQDCHPSKYRSLHNRDVENYLTFPNKFVCPSNKEEVDAISTTSTTSECAPLIQRRHHKSPPKALQYTYNNPALSTSSSTIQSTLYAGDVAHSDDMLDGLSLLEDLESRDPIRVSQTAPLMIKKTVNVKRSLSQLSHSNPNQIKPWSKASDKQLHACEQIVKKVYNINIPNQDTAAGFTSRMHGGDDNGISLVTLDEFQAYKQLIEKPGTKRQSSFCDTNFCDKNQRNERFERVSKSDGTDYRVRTHFVARTPPQSASVEVITSNMASCDYVWVEQSLDVSNKPDLTCGSTANKLSHSKKKKVPTATRR